MRIVLGLIGFLILLTCESGLDYMDQRGCVTESEGKAR